MSLGEGRNVGRFRSAEAEQEFRRAFDTAMASWPEHVDQTVTTGFGPTVVSRASGTADDATPVVLLPGGGSTIAVWGSFADVWRHDREVIAVDSVWDAGRSTQTRPVLTSADTAAWLDEVLDGLGVEEVHLVGYSYGAWVALNQAVESTSRVTRVVSITAVEPPQALVGMPAGAWWKMLRMLLGNDKSYRSYLRWVRGGRMPDSDALDLLLAARAGFAQRGSPRPRRIADEQWETLRERQIPLSVMLGGRSRLVPTHKAVAAVDTYPNVDVAVFRGGSHALLVDEPVAVTEKTRKFLRDHDRGSGGGR